MVSIRRASVKDQKIKLLLYGRPGVGKTTFAAQANDHENLAPALFLNFEGGLLSVSGRGDIDEVEIRSIRDLESAYLAIRNRDARTTQYKTIVIDSASELYNRSLQEAVESRKRKGSPNEVDIGDYGKAGFETLRIFRALRDLPMHVVATAHAKFVYPSSDAASINLEPKEVLPNFPAKLGTSLMGIFDFLWYQYTWEEVEKGEDGQEVLVTHRGILTQDRGAYRAKTRGPNFAAALEGAVEDPSLPELYDLLIQTESTPKGN